MGDILTMTLLLSYTCMTPNLDLITSRPLELGFLGEDSITLVNIVPNTPTY
jgi:hypothetical protein